MPDDEVLNLFKDYQVLMNDIRTYGVRGVLNDLYSFYPEVYVALEKEFKIRQKEKELGALLVNSARR